jgi:hypothetical protein
MFRIHPRTLLKAGLLPTALLMAAGGSPAAFASQVAATANVTSLHSAPSPDSYYTMRLSHADLHDSVDQPCWDPVILVPDENLTRPPIHGHSQWWQTSAPKQIGTYLVRLLTSNSLPRPGRVPQDSNRTE